LLEEPQKQERPDGLHVTAKNKISLNSNISNVVSIFGSVEYSLELKHQIKLDKRCEIAMRELGDKPQEKRKGFWWWASRENKWAGILGILISAVYFIIDERFDLGIFSITRYADIFAKVAPIEKIIHWINSLNPELLSTIIGILFVGIVIFIHIGVGVIVLKVLIFLIKKLKYVRN